MTNGHGYIADWSRSAASYYNGLNQQQQQRVDAAVEPICENPISAPGVIALKGKLKGYRRIKIGNLRLIYRHDQNSRILYVVDLVNRGDAYGG